MAQILDLGKLRFNWTGLYSPITEYTYNDLVKYGPNLYVYVSQTSSTGVAPNPPTTAQWALMSEAFTFRGTYADDTEYFKNDVVTDGTSTYIVNTQHTSTSAVAEGNSNLTIIALGQEGLPNQTGNTNKVLITDGVNAVWADMLNMEKLYVGTDQGAEAEAFETAAELTDTASVFQVNTIDFAQLAMINGTNAENASTDFIAYTADGTNDSGWIDMGITSNNFSAETFGITGPHDGYIFMSAPRGNTFEVSTKQVIGGVATITTTLPHGFTTGNVIRLEEVDSNLDGLQTVVATPTSTTFTFNTSAPPMASTNLSVFGTTYKPYGNGDLVFATDQTGLENKIVFAAGGFATGTTQMQIFPDEMVHIEIATESTDSSSGALVVNGGAGFNGAVSVDGIVRTEGSAYIGAGAEQFETDAELTNARTVVVVEGDPYAQIAITNPTPTSSTDVIIYADNGTDTSGWIDLGITGSEFEQAEFGITGPNDGYVFFEAPEGTTGAGNLVIATGDKGTENKIIIAAGGFATGTEQISITPGQNVHIEIPTPSVSPTTGALTVVGGVGIVGDVNIAGSITFGGTGTTVETENLAVTDALVLVGAGSEVTSNDLSFVTEGKYAIPGLIPARKVVNKSLTSNVATLTTSVAHLFEEGDTVIVAGIDATFDGTYTITTTPNATSFTYEKIAVNVPSTAIGDQNFTVTNKELVSNTATLTIGTHTITTGETIVVTGVDATFNGTHVVTGFTSTTVSYEVVAANVSSTPSSGNVYVNQSVSTATVSAPVRTRWSAVSKRASDGQWNFVGGLTAQPNPNVNYSDPALAYDVIKVGGIIDTGNASVAGTLSVTGNSTFSGTLSSTGNFAVNTNKFTAEASTGNVAVAGTLGVAGVSTLNGAVNITSAANFTGANVTLGSGTWSGAPTFSGNPTFSGSPIFSGNPSFTGSPSFTGGIRVQEMIEDIVDVTHSSNAVTLDYANGNIFYLTNTLTANATVNITNAPVTDGRVFTVNFIVPQGSTGYFPSTMTINGSAATIRWAGGSNPSPTSSSGKIDLFNFSLIRRGGSWTVIANASTNF